MPDQVRQDTGGKCVPHFNIPFLYAFNRLDKSEKGLFPAHSSKNILKKSCRNACGFERKAYLCTRNRENNDRLLSDSETIFEDIYIIRQVVQESESSISMRVPSIWMTLGYDEETESGLRI